MRNRSYLGDGVYASFTERHTILIELEQGRGIELDRTTFHSLIEYIQKHKANFDPKCQMIEIPHVIFDDVVKDLKTLERDVKPTLSS
jgi:hypothetical protein